MKLTRERALELHRKMWSDMRTELGDKPKYYERSAFKRRWILEHEKDIQEIRDFPCILNNCFLCEYAYEQYSKSVERKPICNFCPIDWSSLTPNKDGIHYGTCGYHNDSYLEIWQTEDIDKILLLPEKEN